MLPAWPLTWSKLWADLRCLLGCHKWTYTTYVHGRWLYLRFARCQNPACARCKGKVWLDPEHRHTLGECDITGILRKLPGVEYYPSHVPVTFTAKEDKT